MPSGNHLVQGHHRLSLLDAPSGACVGRQDLIEAMEPRGGLGDSE
jgi:hypothetical protein